MASYIGPPSPSEDPFKTIQDIADQAHKSSDNVRDHLKGIKGKWTSWKLGHQSEAPKWAEDHIRITKALQKAVNDLYDRGVKQIPENVVKILEESQEFTGILASKLPYQVFLKCLRPSEKYLDENKLVVSLREAPKSFATVEEQWHLNLALLMNVYKKTKDPEVRKQVSFLALNYLAKAASISIKDLGMSVEDTETLESMFQLGMLQMFRFYHREETLFESVIREKLVKEFASALEYSNYLLMDSKNIDPLLPLKFSVIQGSKTDDACAEGIADAILKRFQNVSFDEGCKDFMQFPLLFDFTDDLEGLAVVHGDAEKDKQFTDRLMECETKVEKAVLKAVHLIKQKNPDLCKTKEEEEKLAVYIRANIQGVCRTECKGLGVMVVLPLLSDLSLFQLPEDQTIFDLSLKEKKQLPILIRSQKGDYFAQFYRIFLNHTGMRLGGVAGRELVFNFYSLKEFLSAASTSAMQIGQLVRYPVEGKNIRYFENRRSFLETALFKRLVSKLDMAPDSIRVLGGSTLDLIQGLFTEIDDEKWEQLNADPNTRQLIQTSMVQLMNRLANAELHAGDYSSFCKDIELAHAEISTLLALLRPFDPSEFEQIYLQNLTIVPEEFRPFARACVVRSAMNGFAGINACVRKIAPDPQRVYGHEIYFEEKFLVGADKGIDAALQDKTIDHVDLYSCEFNHNVSIDLALNEYKTEDVISDLRKLLAEKPATEHLTVSVDCTIDYVNSEKVRTLLSEFSDEIRSGRLNFVFFRSGQKFDMFGQDNYYGGVVYMVNNGKAPWDAFNDLFTKDTYRTDPLTEQWFCLSNKYAFPYLDQYRKQIFENSRKIIENVPEILKPGNNPYVKVSRISPDMDCSFIDIKIIGPNPANAIHRIEKYIYEKFVERGARIHSRASFGFFNANVNILVTVNNEPRHIRINPGLNEEENQIILDILKEIAENPERFFKTSSS